MINIKADFALPSKDFKTREFKTLTVRCNLDTEGVNISDPEYSVTMPDYMFEELANTEPRFRTEYDQNNRIIHGMFAERTLTPKFMKTQVSKSIAALKDYFSDLTDIINKKHSIEAETLKKKIFIKFNHSTYHERNDRNAAYTGEAVKQDFKYFIGYEVMTEKIQNLSLEKKVVKDYICKIEYHAPNSTTRKRDTNFKEADNLFLSLIAGRNIEDFEKEHSIIDWSQEREDFCERIKQMFIKVNDELSKFLSDMTPDKMDALIQSSTLALPFGGIQ